IDCLLLQQVNGEQAAANYFTMSFSALSGRTLITRRAGLALNITSCLVKGLIPMRALVAGFWITVIFIKPGTTNMPGPFLPILFLIWPESDSRVAATCLRDRPVSWAMF